MRARTLRELQPLSLLAGLLLSACEGAPGPIVEPIDATWTYSVPPTLSDGWTTGSAGGGWLDTSLLEVMYERTRTGALANVHSVVIVKDGVLVAEGYFPGTDVNGQFVAYDRWTLHGTHSVTKSFNSALVGIALREGLITDLDAPLAGFFPEYSASPPTEAQASVTLHHALSMSAGLDWDEWSYAYGDPRNDHFVMDNRPHPIGYVLSKALAVPPGSTFVYNSGLTATSCPRWSDERPRGGGHGRDDDPRLGPHDSLCEIDARATRRISGRAPRVGLFRGDDDDRGRADDTGTGLRHGESGALGRQLARHRLPLRGRS